MAQADILYASQNELNATNFEKYRIMTHPRSVDCWHVQTSWKKEDYFWGYKKGYRGSEQVEVEELYSVTEPWVKNVGKWKEETIRC